MIGDKSIAVVVPAYNEEKQIGVVIQTMPAFVDYIVVVNDASKDKTHDVVAEYMRSKEYLAKTDCIATTSSLTPTLYNRADIAAQQINELQDKQLPKHKIYKDEEYNSKIILIDNIENAKVGGAIAIGYSWCREHRIDCTAVMAGDGQMDPSELNAICKPICNGEADYVKGNRLSHKAARRVIPGTRYFGNSVLSALTKIASGYWRVSDTQTGYTAISLYALDRIELHKIYRTYGMPNDLLVKLNIEKCFLKEVPIKPVYNVGEQSKMKVGMVVFKIPCLLIKDFITRIIKKYLIRDFHPVFLFYLFAFVNKLLALYFFIYIISGLSRGNVTTGTYLGFVLFFIMGWLSTGFAMWLDIYDNDRYQV